MKYIPCIIETLHTDTENYWHITVSAKYCADAAVDFSALHLGRSEQMVFADKDQRFTICPNSVTLGQRTVAVDESWLEAVWCLFLDTYRNGWTNTAHIDQDFSDRNGDLCITIAITL